MSDQPNESQQSGTQTPAADSDAPIASPDPGQSEAADAERDAMHEEFAQEHDPEKHDIAAGEEFRQQGDWTAEASDDPRAYDPEGNLVGGSGQQRRTSSIEEIRDGGYGVGSAAPIDDGATPMGHPVKAWEDTKTYVTPEHAKYAEAEPHLWFTDPNAAEHAGFRSVD